VKHITLTCPNCTVASRAVGDPDESNNGWSGDWHCFNCQSNGTFQMEFIIKTGATPVDPVVPEQPM
jgi:hypothetical protein